MKKLYIAPETTVTKVEMASIICTSLNMLGDSQDNDQALGRRGGDTWDDEEY